MNLTISLILIIIILLVLLKFIYSKYSELKFSKKSQSVIYGKTTEQFFPFMKDYPFEPKNFRFIGSPIDGVSFEEDGLYIIDFKTGASELSQKQKGIKDLIENKKVYFREFRL